MAIYQGAAFTVTFALSQNGTPIDISGWTFESDFRDNVRDTDELVTLTTANGGWSIADAANGLVSMILLESQTEDFPLGRVVFDVMRTDVSPGPVRLFGGSIKVKQPVTR